MTVGDGIKVEGIVSGTPSSSRKTEGLKAHRFVSVRSGHIDDGWCNQAANFCSADTSAVATFQGNSSAILLTG